MNLNDAAENAFYTALLREKHGAVLKIREILKHCAGEVIEAQQARDNWIACGGDYEAQEKDDYAKELADVIICVLIAAKHDSINIEAAAEYMAGWEFNGLLIMASAGEYDDGREWLHVSVSRKSRLPTYDEITRIKRDFIGDDKKAVFVLPEKKNHVNIHENCLHLFYSAENPLPEFSDGRGMI